MSESILIVEDERDLVANLEYNLQREGYRTRSALTGNAALELLADDAVPDLVLLDLMLPDLSGIEICRHLRMQERTRRVPVLMLTAKGEEIDCVVDPARAGSKQGHAAERRLGDRRRRHHANRRYACETIAAKARWCRGLRRNVARGRLSPSFAP